MPGGVSVRDVDVSETYLKVPGVVQALERRIEGLKHCALTERVVCNCSGLLKLS